jgi:hypothetical protein
MIGGLLTPDPDPDFLPIPDLGSRGQKGAGSRIRIRNTGVQIVIWKLNIYKRPTDLS